MYYHLLTNLNFEYAMHSLALLLAANSYHKFDILKKYATFFQFKKIIFDFFIFVF